MNGNFNGNYVLSVQSSSVFKEVSLSKETPFIRIGNIHDCDVRLKRELFDIPVGITVQLETTNWVMSCDAGVCIIANGSEIKNTTLDHGNILAIFNESNKTELFTISFSYDFTSTAENFDTMIDIRNVPQLTIGKFQSAQIKLDSSFVGSEYITLSRIEKGLVLSAVNAPNSATVNGIRVFDKADVSEFDFIGIADYCFYYRNQVLYTRMRNDLHITGVATRALRDETPAFGYPMLNRSPRMIYAFDTNPINILNPPEKPKKPVDNIAMMIMPALLMAVVIILTRSGLIGGLNIGGMGFMIFSLSAMAVGVITSITTFFNNRRKYKRDLFEWNKDYTEYIAEKRVEIEASQRKELGELLDTYPSSEHVRDFVKTFSGRIFERSPQDPDFLHVRIGLGSVPALRTPTYKAEEKVKVANELMHIPQTLVNEYELIHNAPVLIHMRESQTIGVIGSIVDQYEFFKSILLDICVQHSYEEVNVVVMVPQNTQKKYEWIKWLPHINDSGGGFRGIVCDNESRDIVFEYLYSVMALRNAASTDLSGENRATIPYFVVLVLEEYAIKTHPLFQFAENSAALGFSFVYFKEYIESLPQYCQEIIELTPGRGVLRYKNNKAFSCPFRREQVGDESIGFVAERLAPVFVEKIALSSMLTANVTLFELLNIYAPEDLNLIERWSKSTVSKSLAAPLGLNAKGEVQMLDLHEKAHGPHGLVAGTTGSGKSEIMQSYILSAAVSFHPYEVAFVIIDFKGGGMANQFEDLPHLVGKITDIDDHEINRSLLSIRAELEKRKRLFAEFEVNHIDDYIAKFRSGVAETALPHLILIVDEFAELKAEQPDFMKELISTARVGRSLGIHLILATQKPAGQVNEQIWSNSRFKLCLKVATKEDSVEVLRSPLAAEIREPGRAYLQVGNNEIFTLFQSAYSGASAVSDETGSIREFSISEVSFTGKRTMVYERKAEQTADGEKITQLSAMVQFISSYCKNSLIPRLPSICMPPLPDIINYASDGEKGKTEASICIGIYDDPASQVQPPVKVDLSEGNVVLIGSAQTGKTMLLQTMLRGIAENFSPKQISVYILDFASKVLKIYEGLNHVGGVLTDADDEKLKNFFKMMDEEIESRKESFSRHGIGSYEAYCEIGSADAPPIPRIVIMLDNLAVFKEVYQEYEDPMVYICREGLALGITVVATAKQTAGLSYKYFSNFATRIVFNCTESSEYSAVHDRCKLQPKDVEGRGLISIDKIIYETQTFMAFEGETESVRTGQIKDFIVKTEKIHGNSRARSVPSIPPVLAEDYWVQGMYEFDKYEIPIGLTYTDIEPVTIDLSRVGAFGIYGREGSGKSNLVRIVMKYLMKHVFDSPCEAYLVDGYDRQLAEFESYGFVRKFTVDCADFEEIIMRFNDVAVARMDILRAGGSLDNEPLMLCILQNSQVYAPDVIDRTLSDMFKKLVTDARQLKICFILSNVDNNADYSAPEMLRIAREFTQFFLLDDITNVKLFGAGKLNLSELRDFKKSISLGDGYLYDARSGVEKIKLVKCEMG